MQFKELKKIQNNLPLILFVIIVINYIPLIFLNIFTKESNAVGTIPLGICFALQLIILFLFLKNKINMTKEIKLNLILLIISTIVLFVVQIINFFKQEFFIMDVINIVCIFFNVLFLFIGILNIKEEEKNIYLFFRLIIYMALVACAVNFLIYFKEICSLIFKFSDSMIHIKSFFANRNQFAFFLYISMISSMFLIEYENRKLYKISLIIFIINLVLTMSRTGMVAVGLFGILYFFTNFKIDKKKKIRLLIILVITLLIGLGCIYMFFPKIWSLLNNSFFRIENISSMSGRLPIWNFGKDLLLESPSSFLFGVGRFKGIENLVFKGKVFTQFHNIYLEFLVVGGILELIYWLYIFGIVIKKVWKSDINKSTKLLYINMFITYFVYISFESFGRFSIGSSDTLCLIFFTSIPLLHANSIKENKEQYKEKI